MLNGLLIRIMIGRNTVHLAIQFWKLEVKKPHDWVAYVCAFLNRMLKFIHFTMPYFFDVTGCSFLNLLIDVMHTKCLISHIQSFPTQTAPAGYVCPSCSTPVNWTQSPSPCKRMCKSAASTLRITQSFDLLL